MALCGTCADPIGSKHATIQCGQCLRHHHGKCVGVVPHEAEYFETSGTLWVCARCQADHRRLPPLRRSPSDRSLDGCSGGGGASGGGGGTSDDSKGSSPAPSAELSRPLRDLKSELRRFRVDQLREMRELREEQQALGDLVNCVHEKLEDAFHLLSVQAKKMDEATVRVEAVQAECALIRKRIG